MLKNKYMSNSNSFRCSRTYSYKETTINSSISWSDNKTITFDRFEHTWPFSECWKNNIDKSKWKE